MFDCSGSCSFHKINKQVEMYKYIEYEYEQVKDIYCLSLTSSLVY